MYLLYVQKEWHLQMLSFVQLRKPQQNAEILMIETSRIISETMNQFDVYNHLQRL